jgi:hypothetical protein
MPSVPFMVNIITFVLPLVLAIFFTQHTVWKSINGVVAYSNSNTGGYLRVFQKTKREWWEKILSRRLFAYTDQEKLEHRWSCRKKFTIENSVLILQEITRNQNKRSHTDTVPYFCPPQLTYK